MNHITVLEVVASSRGGGAVHVRDLALGLDRSRFAAQVAMPEDGGNVSREEFLIAGIPFHRVDMDRRALWLAGERLGIATVSLDLNRECLPFDDGSFDVAVAGELLEHIIKADSVVDEVRRVLTPGGVFIGSVPNSFHWRARLAFLRGYSLEDSSHLHLFSLPKVRRLLSAFELLELLPVGGIGGHVLPNVSPWLSRPLVHHIPTLFANDFVFRCTRR